MYEYGVDWESSRSGDDHWSYCIYVNGTAMAMSEVANRLNELEEQVRILQIPNEFREALWQDETLDSPEELIVENDHHTDDFIEEILCAHQLPARFYAYRWNSEEERHEVVGYGSTEKEAKELLK